MKIKNIAFGAGILALVFAAFGASESALAYGNDLTIKGGPNYSAERHEEMKEAFENNDYEKWSNLMEGRGRVTEVINKDNFSKFAEISKLIEKGDLEEAKKMRQELGLGLRNGSGESNGMGFHRRGSNSRWTN